MPPSRGHGRCAGGGSIDLVDCHIEDEGLNLELHKIVVLEIILVESLWPVSPHNHLATVLGDLHPLVGPSAGGHSHVAGQWDF
jgi:hypothetical protein